MKNIKVAHLFQWTILFFSGMMLTACGGRVAASEPSFTAENNGEMIAFITATPPPPTATAVPTATRAPTETPSPTDTLTAVPPSATPVPPTATASATVATPPTRTPRPTAPSGLYAGSGVPAFPATRIVIPALGMDAPVQLAPIVGETWDVSALEQSVGHLEGTISPGEAGNIVLAGHVTLAPDGRAGPFYRLGSLQPGDVVTVYRGGEAFLYQIDGLATVAPTDVQVAYPTRNARLTLITCQDYDGALSAYTKRLVVFGHLVDN